MHSVLKGLTWHHAILFAVVALVAIKFRNQIVSGIASIPVVGGPLVKAVA